MWLIIRAGAGPHLFDLGDIDGPAYDHQIAAAKVLLDFPPGHNWVDADWIPNQLPDPVPGRELVPAYDVSVSAGEPHPDLFAVATIHALAELSHVDEEKVAAFMAAHDAEVKAERRRALLAELGRLDPEELAMLMDEHRAANS